MQLRQIAIARAYLRARATVSTLPPRFKLKEAFEQMDLSEVNNPDFVGRIITIGEKPEKFDDDMSLLSVLNHEMQLAAIPGELIIIVERELHNVYGGEYYTDRINSLIKYNPNAILIDSKNIKLVDGALTYNEAINEALEQAQRKGKQLPVFEALADGITSNITLRTFGRIPGRYQAIDKLQGIWRLIINEVFVPLNDLFEAAERAAKMA
jgi:hypothetical protein